MKKFAIAAVAAIVSASPAAATTLIESGTIASSAPTTSTVGVQQFDPTLGTLNSITLFFSSNLTSAPGSISNTLNIPWLYLLHTGGTATLSGGGFNIAETIGTSNQLVFVPRKGSTGIGPFSGSGSSSSTLTSGFTPFVGTGTTSLTFASTSQFFTFPGAGTLNISPLIGGNYTLTYDYTKAAVAAVPEPATWALMLVGVGMIGGSMRRRHKVTIALA